MLLDSFDSRKAAYDRLGVKFCVQGCKAAVIRSNPTLSFLHCKHWDAESEACGWKAMVRKVLPSGRWEVSTNGIEHNQAASNRTGRYGVGTLAQRTSILDKLRTTPVVRPRGALLALRSDPAVDDEGLDLGKVQTLKKKSLGNVAVHRQDIGQLASAIRPFSSTPAAKHTAFFCVHTVRRDEEGKAHLTVVCTTKSLQQRWVEASDSSTCAADGGFKYSLLGRPFTILGVISPAGHLGVCALMLTSSMQPQHIQEGVQGFRASSEETTLRSATKQFSMTDAELAYRDVLSEVFQSFPLMCGYHWVAAIRKYWEKHARLSAKEKEAIWQHHVHPDILLIQRSESDREVQCKWQAVQTQWRKLGIVRATGHTQKDGKHADIVTYFNLQWVDLIKGWRRGYSRTPLPSTNNATEKQIGLTRLDFGNIPGNDLELVKFMRQKTEDFSKSKYDANEVRPVSNQEWRKAYNFKKLLTTNKVVRLTEQAGAYPVFFCWERASRDAVEDRPKMTSADARKLLVVFNNLRQGKPVSYDELKFFSKGRVFSKHCDLPGKQRATQSYGGHCSCPAFQPDRRCLHTLSLGQIPVDADPTPLCTSARGAGRPAKAKNRYASPEDLLQPKAPLRQKGQDILTQARRTLQSLSTMETGSQKRQRPQSPAHSTTLKRLRGKTRVGDAQPEPEKERAAEPKADNQGLAGSGDRAASAEAPGGDSDEPLYPLGSLGGALRGPLLGEWPGPLKGIIEQFLETVFGADHLDNLMRIEWHGWQRLAIAVLMNQPQAQEVQVERGLEAIKAELRLFLPIAGDNMKEIVAGREHDHLQRLLHTDRLKKGVGQVWGRNDCMADSLQLLCHHGILPRFQDGDQPGGIRDAACQANRSHLRRCLSIAAQHRPQGNEFLQENIHSEATIEFFMTHFANEKLRDLPLSGVLVVVHSVWNWQTDLCPPSESRACVRNAVATDGPLVLHLYNTTYGGISGNHFDPLFHSPGIFDLR